MKRFVFVSILCFVTIAIKAQSINGRVIDEQSQPMPFVNVVWLNRTDSTFITGAVTQEDGTFSIATDRHDGLLKVSSVGYSTKYIVAGQGNVGDIQMQPNTQELGEVVIKGRLSSLSRLAERRARAGVATCRHTTSRGMSPTSTSASTGTTVIVDSMCLVVSGTMTTAIGIAAK